MKAFHTIAIPHKDILEGRLTMDVFAADLWEVTQNRGPDEYKESDIFYLKTYMTEGLKNLLSIIEKRLKGKGGDPVIQLQTPFGGGKTHALIAMYHKAEEWKVKKIVLVGTAMTPEETMWGNIEQQLTGEIKKFSGKVAPGKEAIRTLLDAHQPVLILIDELLEYVSRVAGVKVEQSTLASQTVAFMQELTEAVSTLEKACLVVTLPTSILEHFDEGATKLFNQLQHVAGRVEKIYTPVQEDEITKIIRRRLFSGVDENNVKDFINEFMNYAEKEGIIPAGTKPSEYRNRFMDSYPFMPEVVEVLYHRWGSFPGFQRTRGVLRLLALVIHSMKEKNNPYISLADFDLSNQEIRQELIKHIGSEYNAVIANDITDVNAGAKKVDMSLGDAYKGQGLGRRTATTIFLYSFSGGQEHGTNVGELKRSATTVQNPSALVAESAEKLKGELFYLQNIGDKYFFSNQPNLNRMLLTTMENIKKADLVETERELLKSGIKGKDLKIFIWTENPSDIFDSEELKLIILKSQNKGVMEGILKNKGQTPRVYRNTVFFLFPLESERTGFEETLKRKLAYEQINLDKGINLSDNQKNDIKKEMKRLDGDVKDSIRRLYRMVAIPFREGFKEVDLGIPTYGEDKGLDQDVYDKLRYDGEILEKIAPKLIKEKYLTKQDYVLTELLYQSSLKTPGENRPKSKEVYEQGIIDGVRQGTFGLGELSEGKPVCKVFKDSPTVYFSDSEVLISEQECERQKESAGGGVHEPVPGPFPGPGPKPDEQPEPGPGPEGPKGKTKDRIELQFTVPRGKVSGIMGMMNLLQSRFNTLEIELKAKDGSMTEQEYEDKILETFRQLGIEYEED